MRVNGLRGYNYCHVIQSWGRFQGEERENGLQVAMGNSYSDLAQWHQPCAGRNIHHLRVQQTKPNPQERVKFTSEEKGKGAFTEQDYGKGTFVNNNRQFQKT